MSATSPKTFLVCHGAWSAGWAWKKMHPLMQAAGHRLVTPTYTGLGERAHLANPSIDLDSHIEDMLNVIKYEDLRDIVLIGHSYGGMVATGVADRARDKVRQLIYVDAFVPGDGQSLLDLNEVARPRMQELAKTGDGWRVPPNPTPPDTSPADVEWLSDAPRRHADQMFRDQAQAAGRRVDAAAQLHLRHAHHAGRYVRAVRQNDEGRSRLELLRDRRQPFAERHRAGGVDGVTAKDRCLRLRPLRELRQPRIRIDSPPSAQQAGKPVVDVDRGGRVMTARTTAGIETWSTGLVEPERRLDYWIGAVCECFLEMDITTQVRSGFDCSVQRGQLDTIGINRVQGSAQHVYRRKASVARSTANYYYLLCKTDNDWTVMQNGHASRMRPMDLVLLDSRRCYEFNFPVNADTLSLELPIHWVESWISDPERRIGQRIDGRAGWGAALSAFACQLTPELATDLPLPARVLTDQLGALLALGFGSEIPATPAEQRDAARLLDQIGRAIRLRYAEPGLTAVAVAEDLRVSERTLHRCLNKAGLTFSGLLNDCRMAAARRMLSEPRFDRISVGGIGLRVGLSDPSHFIRQCRRHLGMTPGAFRRQR